MGISVLQHNKVRNAAQNNITFNFTANKPISPGSTLLFGVGATTNTGTITQAPPGATLLVGPVRSLAGSASNFSVWIYAIPNAPGASSWRFNFSTINTNHVVGCEISEALAIDQTASNSHNNVVSEDSGTTANIAQAVEFMFAVIVNDTGGSASAPTGGFAILDDQGGVDVIETTSFNFTSSSIQTAHTSATITSGDYVGGIVTVIPGAVRTQPGITYGPPMKGAPWFASRIPIPYTQATPAAAAAVTILKGDAGVFNITGGSASLLEAHLLVGGTGVFTITAGSAALLEFHVLVGGTGTYTITAGSASFITTMRGDAATYTITAGSAAFIITMEADAATYLIGAGSAALLESHLLVGGTGVFTITAGSAALLESHLLVGGTGVFIITGGQSGQAATMKGETGVFVIGGGHTVLSQRFPTILTTAPSSNILARLVGKFTDAMGITKPVYVPKCPQSGTPLPANPPITTEMARIVGKTTSQGNLRPVYVSPTGSTNDFGRLVGKATSQGNTRPVYVTNPCGAACGDCAKCDRSPTEWLLTLSGLNCPECNGSYTLKPIPANTLPISLGTFATCAYADTSNPNCPIYFFFDYSDTNTGLYGWKLNIKLDQPHGEPILIYGLLRTPGSPFDPQFNCCAPNTLPLVFFDAFPPISPCIVDPPPSVTISPSVNCQCKCHVCLPNRACPTEAYPTSWTIEFGPNDWEDPPDKACSCSPFTLLNGRKFILCQVPVDPNCTTAVVQWSYYDPLTTLNLTLYFDGFGHAVFIPGEDQHCNVPLIYEGSSLCCGVLSLAKELSELSCQTPFGGARSCIVPESVNLVPGICGCQPNVNLCCGLPIKLTATLAPLDRCPFLGDGVTIPISSTGGNTWTGYIVIGPRVLISATLQCVNNKLQGTAQIISGVRDADCNGISPFVDPVSPPTCSPFVWPATPITLQNPNGLDESNCCVIGASRVLLGFTL
jgi:hypothetical protein